MDNKYLNEAIIGNKEMIATYTSKGELLRVYFPSKDFRQYVNFFHTGVKINNSDLIYSFKTAKLTLTSEEEVPWTLDGEFGGIHTRVDIENCHEALNLYLRSTKTQD